jgi:hypothetical protein
MGGAEAGLLSQLAPTHSLPRTPAKAGVQIARGRQTLIALEPSLSQGRRWTPAFAGVHGGKIRASREQPSALLPQITAAMVELM